MKGRTGAWRPDCVTPGLRHDACLENIDYAHQRGVDKSLIKTLSTGQWVDDHLNILITGPCGVGKSFLACALSHKACLLGHSAIYTRAPRLLNDLAVSRGDGRYNQMMRSFAKTNVLVIDDWGLERSMTLNARIFWKSWKNDIIDNAPLSQANCLSRIGMRSLVMPRWPMLFLTGLSTMPILSN